MKQFRKILIANRGEIAIRVMRAATELGIKTVAVYAHEDRLSLHRFKADESWPIGEGLSPVGAYLSIAEILRVARESGADAVHPGYGMLSENPDFVTACTEAGLAFIGPSADVMRALGDKASARKVAIGAGVPVIPATGLLGDDFDAIRAEAAKIGYPLMLKASWGGGGRGMRVIQGPEELEANILEGRREAEAAFGNGEGYLEKMITRARHIEVQILGDSHGGLWHLFERDCTVQRRNQKVVERAPAPYLSEEQRREICDLGLKIGQAVGYVNAGTVEFLMDMDSGRFHFIEVNPRIQVEHTVTEEVTGVDIVRAQICIAQGQSLSQATGMAAQSALRLQGHAIQCRITTEDPQSNFLPDYGRLSAYRASTGPGIRLDGGTAYEGAVITPYYDSLLEKVTARALTPAEAVLRLGRALSEFRIRGVATNISFVANLLQHPAFLDDAFTTRFIDSTPELLRFDPPQDRASRLLTWLGEITVNGHPEVRSFARPRGPAPRAPKPGGAPQPGTADLLREKGPKALADHLLAQKALAITDTTMRDAHQSLLATRMRSLDMIRAAPAMAAGLPQLFSVECWGGATFDVAYRYLQECPWQRLRDLRAQLPNVALQMLLRGANGVGYTTCPDNVVQAFIARAAETGVDIFRVFDSLNWVENMRVSMDAVLESGKVLEGTICYTGDLQSLTRPKYDLAYYLKMARDLQAAGSHILGLKDMAGVLKPEAAKLLVRALKEETGLPVHLHSHDTAGLGAATLLAAAEAGVDVVDCAMDALSGTTSQPAMGSIVAALQGQPRDTGLDFKAVRAISDYWEQVRARYAPFEAGMASPSSEVFVHEMPGGQFTNLRAQARSLGLESRWGAVAARYAEVNQMFGDIVKVTPSSKVVGDMALMMVSQDISSDDVLDPAREIAFPESVVDMMAGNLGQPPGGWPSALQARVLQGRPALKTRPGHSLPPTNLQDAQAQLQAELGGEAIDQEDLCGWLMYPKVFVDYRRRAARFGPVRVLPTDNFFFGMEPGEEITAEIAPGKTLEIRLLARSEPDAAGQVKLFFELNGQPRLLRVQDQSRAFAQAPARAKADPANPAHISAPMSGLLTKFAVKPGQRVRPGDALLTLEAMKMETTLRAERAGVVERLCLASGEAVEARDLLIELRPAL